VKVERLDHLVLTVAKMGATIAFYEKVMGMRTLSFGAGRKAMAFGQSKINLHPAEAPFKPNAACPMPGSADLCFIVSTPIADVVTHLAACGVAIEDGPGERSGALGPIMSVYFRDPDHNLIEVSNYVA